MFNWGNKVIVDQKKIDHLLTKNVEDVFVLESLKKRLNSGKQLTIKLGFDPTGSKIHLGRAVTLHKLKEFQDLGHKIVFVIGNFTAQIGDPSDKLEKRPMLDKKEVQKNLRDYKNQIGTILDLKKVEFRKNGDWLSKLTFSEITQLAESFTVSQMTSRRNFKERLDKGDEVSLREFMYPLMQGYDSVVINSDIEIGGFDQLFNLKAGRVIQKFYKKQEQEVITTVMLEGTDGRKMSTSWGNVVNITDEPNDMFGKIMSLKDELIVKYFKICTEFKEADIDQIEIAMKAGRLNPRNAKKTLAKEIVEIYHSAEDAGFAELNFENIFSKGEVPEDVVEVKVEAGKDLVDVLLDQKIISSKNEWRRLIEQKGITILEKDLKVEDPNYKISETETYRIGKKRFLKVLV